MSASISRFSFCVFVLASLAGCGGSGGGSGGGCVTNCGGGGNPTIVTYTFTRTMPTAVATQIGTGAYTQAALQSGTLTLSIPSGTTNYSAAYQCPEPTNPAAAVTGGERVILASTQDGTSFNLFCPGSIAVSEGTATVQVNAAAIPGATGVNLEPWPHPQPWSGTTLSFSSEMPSGIHDVAICVTDTRGNTVAVRILRNQTIPGALNGGNTVVFDASDQTVPQTIAYNNVPSGFTAPSTMAGYLTAGGVAVSLSDNATSQYLAVPSSEVQSGDSYDFTSEVASTTTPSEYMFVQKPPGSGGGPQTFTFPAPWSYTGPTAAALPTFNFDYAGFSGATDVTRVANIAWPQGTLPFSLIGVTASANYQNGATAISIPDLSGLNGFTAPAPSGTTIHWDARIAQGLSVDSFVSGTTVSSVQNSGTYTEP